MRGLPVRRGVRRYQLHWLVRIISWRQEHHLLRVNEQSWARLIASLFLDAHEHGEVRLKVHVGQDLFCLVRASHYDLLRVSLEHLSTQFVTCAVVLLAGRSARRSLVGQIALLVVACRLGRLFRVL